MSHFSLKSLTFYGVAIGSVTLLFNVVTAYGNSNLKAQPAIDGKYTLDPKMLPKCLKSQAVELVILQSGIYLNGAIVPTTKDDSAPSPRRQKPTLMGRFQNGELSLSGTLPELSACASSPERELNIEGRVVKDILQGQIQLNGQTIPFQSRRQKPSVEESH